MLQRKGRQSGFTLMELMIVIAILGILAAIAITSYNFYFARARTSPCKADLGGVMMAQESYFALRNLYALNLGSGVDGLNYTMQPNNTILFSVTADRTMYNACCKAQDANETTGYDSSENSQYRINSVVGAVLGGCPAATNGDDFTALGWTRVD
jgi:prepilin-type N-terminal cleavage/methylation domain-containing protein